MYYHRFVKVISFLHLALQFTNELLTLDASFFPKKHKYIQTFIITFRSCPQPIYASRG